MESSLHGCIFHWKQALVWKLVTWGFTQEQAACVTNQISFLTALKPTEIPDVVKYSDFQNCNNGFIFDSSSHNKRQFLSPL
jgi:hypothetical protein